MSIRKILFGYKIINGRHVIVEDEAQIVRDIYTHYISGKSLKAIADDLSNKQVPYHLDKTTWSKNVISRILASSQYVGEDGYPQIIDKPVFDLANNRKSSMGGTQAEISDITAMVKSKMVCACCGQNMGRRNKWRSREKWLCPSGCKVDLYLGDREVFTEILNTFIRVQNNPELLRTYTIPVEYSPSMEVIRQGKEIDRVKEQPGVEFAVLSKMILKNVEYKFECCPLDRSKAMTDALMDKYRNLPKITELDEMLIRETVDKISVNRNGSLTITFINHAKITNNEQEGS